MANGCSYFPDKIFGYNLTPACNNHDANYWYQNLNRKESDRILRENVIEILPSWLKFIGWIMYFAVRLFGFISWNKYKGGNYGKEN